MKKAFSCILLALALALSAFGLYGCADRSGGQNQTQGGFSQIAQTFVTNVGQIETPITLDSGGAINGAYLIYDMLTEEEKADARVAESKAKLDGYKTEYDVLREAADEQAAAELEARKVQSFVAAVGKLPSLSNLTTEFREDIDDALAQYAVLTDESKQLSDVAEAYEELLACDARVKELEEAAHQEEIRVAAQAFIDGVAALGPVTVDSLEPIEDLIYDYEDMTDEVRAYEGVAEAYAALQQAYDACLKLLDEQDIAEFRELVAAITPASEVTLGDENAIEDAEAAYESLSDAAKQAEGIAELWQIVQDARARYDALFAVAEAERVQKFIAAVDEIPSYSDPAEIDISWYGVLHTVSELYYSLSFDSQELPEVEEAFQRWNAVQTIFDSRGYEQIPMVDPNIIFSGDMPPHIVLQMEENMFKPLREFFGVGSNGQLSQYVTMWLNVYVGGVYVGEAEMDIAAAGHIIANTIVVNCLKEVAATHPEVVSGAKFSFSIYFKDKNNEYIPSAATKVSEEKVYTW